MMAAVAAAAILAGCSSTASRRPVPYAIELHADPAVNPDANGRPSPIQVTVYELSSPSTFESRDFFTLQGDAQAALGKELLNTEQIILRPGQTYKVSQPGNVEARVVGIVAAYRDLESSRWRLVIPLPEPQNTNIYKVWQFSPNEETVRVSVGSKGVEVVDRERSWWPF
ncbi:type VI secretion system lipoprotein TssJ [Bordetella sp. 2513F-2]